MMVLLRQTLRRLLKEMRRLPVKGKGDETPAPTTAPTLPRTADRVETSAGTPCQLTRQIRAFLLSNYDFRYNRLTEETEFRPIDNRDAPFAPIGKRELNSFCIKAHEQGISCWDKDLSRYIYSTNIPAYHPFHLYMEELPDWDGTDRLDALARRVSDHPLWVKSFHTWMLALTAQWAGIPSIHANSVAPILISSEQGRHDGCDSSTISSGPEG